MIPTSLSLPSFRAWRGVRRCWPGILLLLALHSPARADDSMRCGSRLVDVEARAAELLSICGEPAFRDVWSGQALAPGAIAEQEEWTYNFGAQQLLRVVRLRNGRVVAIGSDGYGFPVPEPGQRHCSPEQLVDGMSKYRLLSACGDPLTRSVAQTFFQPYRPVYRNGYPVFSDGPVVQVYREEWIYDFGPNVFMRVLTIENGRITDIKNGERGNSRH